MNFFSGVAQGMIAGEAAPVVRRTAMGEENPTRPNHIDLLEEQNKLLHDILKSVSAEANPPKESIANLFPVGQTGFGIQDNGFNHLSIFSATSIPVSIRVPGLPAYLGTLTQGWSQIDLSYGTSINSGDANTYPVLISYRDDAIGSAL